MAELARDYHEKLQNEDLADTETQKLASDTTFETVSAKLSAAEKSEMAKYLTREDIEHVIDLLPNGKSFRMNYGKS